MEVSVEVAVLSPSYTVKTTVKNADEFLDWIQKTIDKTGKHVLCGLPAAAVPVSIDFDATGSTNLFNTTINTITTNLSGIEGGDGGEG